MDLAAGSSVCPHADPRRKESAAQMHPWGCENCLGPRQRGETAGALRPIRSRSDGAIFVSSSQEAGGEPGVWLRVRILKSLVFSFSTMVRAIRDSLRENGPFSCWILPT
jgi:hypothetical protein